jgi:integrase
MIPIGEGGEPLAAPLGFGEADPTALRGAVSAWPRDGGDDALGQALAHARRLMANDRAESTRDKYVRSWASFVRWVAETMPAQYSLPAHPAVVGLYVGALRSQGRAKKTILVHLAAIAYAHELVGAAAPWSRSVDLKREIRGVRRESRGEDEQQGKAIERERAAEILSRVHPTTALEYRDYALFCVGWLTALRRSNLAALRVRDVTIRRDDVDQRRYLDVFVRRSKTDQEAKGRGVTVPELNPPLRELDEDGRARAHPLCAVRAVEKWLELAVLDDQPLGEVRDAPLFPSFQHGKVTGRQLSGEDVRRIVKALLERAQEDSTLYSPHSLRRGFATSMQNGNVPDALGMEQGGWKDKATYHGYNRVDKARRNAVRDLFG